MPSIGDTKNDWFTRFVVGTCWSDLWALDATYSVTTHKAFHPPPPSSIETFEGGKVSSPQNFNEAFYPPRGSVILLTVIKVCESWANIGTGQIWRSKTLLKNNTAARVIGDALTTFTDTLCTFPICLYTKPHSIDMFFRAPNYVIK